MFDSSYIGPWGRSEDVSGIIFSLSTLLSNLRSLPLHVFDLQKDEADEDRLKKKQNHKVAIFHNVEFQRRANHDIKKT